MLELIIFCVVFLFITNWFQVLTITSAFTRGNISKMGLKDKWLYDTVYKKTGLKLLSITLFKDRRMYAMMAGLPIWPKMILSEGLYKNLNKDELEWVILHEAGHCVLWHNLKTMLIQLIFVLIGFYLIYFNRMNLFAGILLATIYSFGCIQVIRWLIEYQADMYSIERVDNPNGVITAQKKFRNAKYRNLFRDERSIWRFLLHWNIYPKKRIDMAKARLLK